MTIDPDLADLRRRLLRLVRQAHKLDRGSLLVLAAHVDDALERIDTDQEENR